MDLLLVLDTLVLAQSIESVVCKIPQGFHR